MNDFFQFIGVICVLAIAYIAVTFATGYWDGE